LLFQLFNSISWDKWTSPVVVVARNLFFRSFWALKVYKGEQRRRADLERMLDGKEARVFDEITVLGLVVRKF
jgi:hypothetical protein